MGPFELVLVTNHVSAGLFEGIQQVGRGGALKIYIPPPRPEGDDFRLGVPPGSAIVYELELLDFKDTAPEDFANSLLPPAPEPSPPPPSGYSQTKLIEAWGWNVAQQTPASTFGLSDADLLALLQGLDAGVRNQPAPVDLARGLREVQEFVRENKERVRLATKRKRLDEINAFFTRLKKNKHVLETTTGLRYEVLKPGLGPPPRPGQIVVVEYTGRLLDGTVFDRTDNEPLHIQVGLVVPGWNEGIQHVAKGGRIKLYIPPSIGYGDENCSGVISSVPGGSVLLYDIRLLDIQDASTDTPPPATPPN
jgi:FKBP-type peptidyl-prolyl cis-trans isomerase